MSDQDTTSLLETTPAPADQAPAAPTVPPVDESVALLAAITNAEGVQKYSSTADALKAMPHANAHISQLEAENAKLKEAALTAKATEDILEKLSAKPDQPAQPAVAELDDARIAEVVQQQMNAKERADLVKTNQQTAAAQLKAVYGSNEKANEVVKAKAAEMGLSVDFLLDVAAKSPKAFLSTLGINEPNPNAVPRKLDSTVNLGSTPQANPRTFKMNGSTSNEVVSEWQRHKPQQ